MSACRDPSYVRDSIKRGHYIDAVKATKDYIPSPSATREYLERLFSICSDRPGFKLIKVEEIDDYNVFICVPNGKSECDYIVWRYSPYLNPDIKIPTHDDLGLEYNRLKRLDHVIERDLIKSVLRLVRDRWTIDNIMSHYFSGLPQEHAREVKKFLATLKWIALQEDVNYPPPKRLGSKFTLALYLLLEGGFDLKDIRKILRF